MSAHGCIGNPCWICHPRALDTPSFILPRKAELFQIVIEPLVYQPMKPLKIWSIDTMAVSGTDSYTLPTAIAPQPIVLENLGASAQLESLMASAIDEEIRREAKFFDSDEEYFRKKLFDAIKVPAVFISGGTTIVDPARFPHSCPRCLAPAYIGLMKVECSREECG